MKYELPLPSSHQDFPRSCQMSAELFQNARQTMGELRDILRASGVSWDFIQHQVDLAAQAQSPIEKALGSMDPYSTGPGHSLRDLPSNIW